ncbi:MAG: GNAT family N-acetyltransferase [Paramuribaculum sp.]|nr:GNAT family N-acetyltransferase [Paramuribaculum sp.]
MSSTVKIFAKTERLILRQWKHEDLPTFVAMNSNPEVMRYFPEPLTEAETRAFYDRIQIEFERMDWGLYAVELKSTGSFIGYVGLHEIGFNADFTPGVEIGWRLDADYHNQGLATEAATKVLELAEGFGFEKIYSFTAVVNKPSERVMQKIGMKKTGEFDHPKLSSDSPLLRHVLYQIEFPS